MQCHALAILHQQTFRVTAEQLRAAEDRLDRLRPREHLPLAEVELLRNELRAILERISPETGDGP